MINIMVIIFNYFVVVFSQYVLFKLFNEFYNKKIKFQKKLIIVILIASIIEMIIANLLTPIVNCLISISYFILIIKYFSKAKISDVLYYSLVVWLMIICIDLIAMLLFNLASFYLPFIKENMLIVKPLSTIIYILLIFFAKLKFVKNVVNKVHLYLEKFNFSVVYLIFILMFYFILGALGSLDIENEKIIILSFCLLILFTIIIVKFVIYRYEIYNLKKTNELLIKNNEFYIKLLNDYRILKHNLTSQLIGIKSLSNNKTRLLIDDLIKEYNATFQSNQDINDAPTGLNGIIYEKLYNFNNKKLNVKVENKIKNKILDVITPRSYNLLCEALGVVLDNAMEAAIKSSSKVLYLNFDESKDRINISVINTFKGAIDLEKIGTVNYTTKENGRGYGLYSLIGRKKVHLKNHIKNDLYIVEIEIDKIKEFNE